MSEAIPGIAIPSDTWPSNVGVQQTIRLPGPNNTEYIITIEQRKIEEETN